MANIYFIINGNNNLPIPSTMSVALQDIDGSESGRNQKGKMQRDRVAKGKRKVNYTWSGLNMAEMSQLLQAIDGVSMELKYPDPYEGGYKTIKCYVGDRTAPVWKKGSTTTGEIIWESLSANFVEF
ncbi:MAG: hypothetical protein PUE56_04370 [Clostridium sp.]|nr:hypothetical protein [Clostridium sp.]